MIELKYLFFDWIKYNYKIYEDLFNADEERYISNNEFSKQEYDYIKSNEIVAHYFYKKNSHK